MCNSTQGYYQSCIDFTSYFQEQLAEARPLVQEDIDRINQGRREHSAPECYYVVDDTLLYGMILRDDPNHPAFDEESMQLSDEMPHKILEMVVFVLRGGKMIGMDGLVFQRASGKYPIFVLKSDDK